MSSLIKSNELQVLQEKILQCETLIDLKGWLEEVCHTLEVEKFCFLIYRLESLHAYQYGLLSNYPEFLLRSYSSKNQFKFDPSLQYALDFTTPITWSNLMKLEQYSNVRAKQFMMDLNQAGLFQGICIPFRQSFNQVAVINLVCHPNRNIEHLLVRINQPVYTLFAQFIEIFQRRAAADKAIDPMQFSSREKECLFWACEGKTSWEISIITGITERTVTFHLNNAGKKLGAMNRQHAVARAILTGVVKPVIA